MAIVFTACTPAPPPAPAPATSAPRPTPTTPATETADDTTLRWAIGEPSTVVPIHATSPDELVVVDALYDSLTAWDQRLRPRPAAALRWESRDGGRTWRFHLRPSATFHDGTRVTARHFRVAWDALASRGRAHHHLRDVVGYTAVRRGRTDTLRGVTAVDATTLDVRLRRPLADFPVVAGHPALGPLRRATDEDAQQPAGNGAFALAEPWDNGRFIRLRRAAPPARRAGVGAPVEEVVFRFFDEATAFIAYEQQRVDVAPVPAGAVGSDGVTVTPRRFRGPGLLRGPLPSTYFLWFDTRSAPFDRVAVRRGVSLALDRERLAEDVFESGATPATGAVPRILPDAGAPVCSACRHRPRRAERLLRAAGVEELTLWVNRGGDHERVANRVSADLARVGVTVEVRVVELDRYLEALRKGRPGLYRFGWTVDYPTSDNALRPLFHSTAAAAGGGVNFARYERGDVDRLLDRAAATMDPGGRARLFQRAEQRIVERDQAIIPLVALRRRVVVSGRVLDLSYGPFGTADLTTVRLARRAADP